MFLVQFISVLDAHLELECCERREKLTPTIKVNKVIQGIILNSEDVREPLVNEYINYPACID